MPKFVDTSALGDCIFCRIVRAEIPSALIYEDELTLAFMDLGQVNPGHVLVATKRHATNLFEITKEEGAAVMNTVQKIAASIERTFNAPGLMLVQANGKEGEQTVFHFHLHVLPRHANDGVGLLWPRKEPGMEALKSYAKMLTKNIQEIELQGIPAS